MHFSRRPIAKDLGFRRDWPRKNNPSPFGSSRMQYRCSATSVQGFIQQLAVGYIARGYYFYVVGRVPEGRDPQRLDEKLIAKYDVSASKGKRARRKALGF